MKPLRAMLVTCAVWGIIAPRTLLPCCEGSSSGTQAVRASCGEGRGPSCCADECDIAGLCSDSHDSAPHDPRQPARGCTGCDLICCAKLLIAPGTAAATHLLLAQTDVLPGTSDTLPSRLMADGIFRPPRGRP